MKSATTTITINGISREVAVVELRDGLWMASGNPFACMIGRSGTKVHFTGGNIWKVSEKTPANANVFMIDGSAYYLSAYVSMRNKQARIIGFADAYRSTEKATKQTYYGSK